MLFFCDVVMEWYVIVESCCWVLLSCYIVVQLLLDWFCEITVRLILWNCRRLVVDILGDFVRLPWQISDSHEIVIRLSDSFRIVLVRLWNCREVIANVKYNPNWPPCIGKGVRVEGARPGLDSRSCSGLFPGQVIPVTENLVLRWQPCKAPGLIGSVLGLVDRCHHTVAWSDSYCDLHLLS